MTEPVPRGEAEPDGSVATAEAVRPRPVHAEFTDDPPSSRSLLGVATSAAGAEVVVEPTVEPPPGEVPTTRPRAARAPAWAWVAITLMALLLAIGLTTLAVARNANPSTPAAVDDAQTLVLELEALNGYLATTNKLLADAIANAEQMSAKAQAKLAGLSSQLDDTGARVGEARSLLGGQLSKPTRSKLDQAQQQLQSLRRTLAQRREQLQQQHANATAARVEAIEKLAPQRASAVTARIDALESKQAENDAFKAQLQAEADRLRTEADQLRATIQAQREHAQAVAAQVQELRRALARLRRIVDRLSSRR